MAEEIDFETFVKVEMRVGTVVDVQPNTKARVPAYILKVDFGEEGGVKTSSAQLTDLYEAQDLIGKQVVAVCNFPPKRIAGIKSEVLILGASFPDGKGTVILTPSSPHARLQGSRIH